MEIWLLDFDISMAKIFVCHNFEAVKGVLFFPCTALLETLLNFYDLLP